VKGAAPQFIVSRSALAQTKVYELGDVALGQLGFKRRVTQGLSVELLPLVDMQQEPVGAGLLGGGKKAANAAADSVVIHSQDRNLLFDTLIGLEGWQVDRRWVEAANEGVQRLGAGAQTGKRW
jgi:hypothetical protein